MSGPHEKTAVDVQVLGDVQGVGFRFQAMRRADELDVAGWISNEDDGSVRAHLEGLGYRVDSMLAWMREGTTWSRVRRVDVREGTFEGLEGFRTR